jgi:hypothetical protein
MDRKNNNRLCRQPPTKEKMNPRFVGVTGLPRGSTLLFQLLAQHPEIQCEGHSSPLCNTLLGMTRPPECMGGWECSKYLFKLFFRSLKVM